jgi:hypothetical protein
MHCNNREIQSESRHGSAESLNSPEAQSHCLGHKHKNPKQDADSVKTSLVTVNLIVQYVKPPMRSMRVFYAWWIFFPRSGALAEGISQPVSHEHDHA